MNLVEMRSRFGYLEKGAISFGVHEFIVQFDDTFSQSSEKLLFDFLDEFSYAKKWIIASDYVINDKNKPNDTVVFSLIPYIVDLDKINVAIHDMAPSDLKKTKEVDLRFLNFLSQGPVFNICIELDKNRRLHTNEREYHLEKLNSSILQLEKWCISTPSGRDRFLRDIKKFKNAELLVKSPGANLKAFRDIELVSTLAAYLMAKISTAIDIDVVAWLSDRDAMFNFKSAKLGHYMLDCTKYLYHVLATNSGARSQAQLCFGIPEVEGRMWYDTINRIPDLLAGAFADYNYKENKLSHDKYVSIIERLFVAEKRNLFFRIALTPEIQASRLTWGLMK